jgi:mRNA-degrading endonuclease RelE of RelBE toxin-antitoxin system
VPEVRLARRAVRDLDDLPKRTARRIADVLEELAADPGSTAFDVKPLVGRRPWSRLRVGDFRVLYRPAQAGAVLLVGRVVDRKELDRAVRTLPE